MCAGAVRERSGRRGGQQGVVLQGRGRLGSCGVAAGARGSHRGREEGLRVPEAWLHCVRRYPAPLPTPAPVHLELSEETGAGFFQAALFTGPVALLELVC